MKHKPLSILKLVITSNLLSTFTNKANKANDNDQKYKKNIMKRST